MTDLSPGMLRELNGVGYTPTRRELDDVAIFHITPDSFATCSASAMGS